jgi:Trk K+ transport system NAD-binding subunit
MEKLAGRSEGLASIEQTRNSQLTESSAPILGSNQAGAEFLELTIPHTARSIGKPISQLRLPRSAVLVSIVRGSEVIIPRGDTRLHAGDIVTALCENNVAGDAREALLAAARPRKRKA